MSENVLINEGVLKELRACQDGIDFFTRNIGELSVDKLDLIKGDYENYVHWLKRNITKYNSIKSPVKEFEHINLGNGEWKQCVRDKFGNILYYQNSDMFWYKYTRDKYGNELSYKNSGGKWREYVRDEKGNVLTYKTSIGVLFTYVRDQNGNLLRFEDSDGYWEEYTRDKKGNVITRLDSNNISHNYKYKHTDKYFKMYENSKLIVTVYKENKMETFGLKDEKIIKIVNKIRTKYGFRNVGTSHGVSHGDEVFKNMLELREHSFFNKFEFDIIGLAVMAYAHDMYADEDRKNHHTLAYKKILKRKPKFLKNLSDHVFKNVCLAIKQHRASTYEIDIDNPYVNIMRVADKGKPNINDIIRRAYLYAKENNKNASNITCVRITLKHLLDKYSYDGYAFKNDIIYSGIYTESVKKICKNIDNMSVSDLSKYISYLN